MQEKATLEGRVPQFNNAMVKHKCFRAKMNRNPDTGQYFKASCSGPLAKRLCKTAGADIDDEAGKYEFNNI
jgi:hypothetical protein